MSQSLVSIGTLIYVPIGKVTFGFDITPLRFIQTKVQRMSTTIVATAKGAL